MVTAERPISGRSVFVILYDKKELKLVQMTVFGLEWL